MQSPTGGGRAIALPLWECNDVFLLLLNFIYIQLRRRKIYRPADQALRPDLTEWNDCLQNVDERIDVLIQDLEILRNP